MHDGVLLSVQMNTGTGMVWIYPDSTGKKSNHLGEGSLQAGSKE